MNAPAAFLDAEPLVPLVVDVDGTLLSTDLLHEAALQFVARRPTELWRLPAWLARGKAALKAGLADAVPLDIDTLPLREETVGLIRRARDDGRPVFLASASEARYVAAIAERVGDVTGVFASDGRANLAGARKAAALVDSFGSGGFDYVGDRPVDMAVWPHARRVLAVSHDDGFERRLRRRFPEADLIARPRSTSRDYLRAMRPHQWAKNLLVFLPVAAAHRFDPLPLLAALLAFVCFSLAASSAYILNDLLDLPGDRHHPRKRARPFAAGRLPIGRGLAVSGALMALAVMLSFALPGRFAAVLVGYVGLTLAYSFVLKRQLVIDVIALAGLYAIRVLGGLAAIGQPSSPWLLMFSLFLFLSLAIVKRCAELIVRREAGKLDTLGRAYRVADLGVLMPLAAAAGYAAVMVVTLYLSSSEVIALYAHPQRLWLVCVLLIYWITRVLMLSHRGEMHDDPLIFALTDRASWATATAAGLVVAAAI